MIWERHRQTDIDLLFHLFMHSLVASCCALMARGWDLTCNLGVFGWCSKQLSYLARPGFFFSWCYCYSLFLWLMFVQFIQFLIVFWKWFYLFIFRERGREGERGRETSMCGCLSRAPSLGTWPATQACALTGNWTSDPLLLRPVLNPLSYTSQGYILFSFNF